MIALVEPCERYLQSYIEAYDEYEMHGVETYAFEEPITSLKNMRITERNAICPQTGLDLTSIGWWTRIATTLLVKSASVID